MTHYDPQREAQRQRDLEDSMIDDDLWKQEEKFKKEEERNKLWDEIEQKADRKLMNIILLTAVAFVVVNVILLIDSYN